MLGSRTPYRYLHSFWSDQFEDKLEYVGHARKWDRFVVRGSLKERKFLGFYLPPLALWAGGALIPFAVLRWLVERFGLYRFVWHRSLFNLALYVLLMGGVVFLGSFEF